MNKQAFKILCRAFFPDCEFIEEPKYPNGTRIIAKVVCGDLGYVIPRLTESQVIFELKWAKVEIRLAA